MRSFGNHDLGAFPQKHPDRNFQSAPAWVHHADRAISPLRSAEDLQSSPVKRVKGVEDLNIRIVRAQGIVGVGVTIHHIHFLVPGGGIAPDGKSWIPCRPGFFLPVQVLSRMFRGLFLHYLEKAFAAGKLNFFSAHRHLHDPAAFRRYLAPAWNADWVVYAKRPFAGPAQVLDYVGRYTHRVAISNSRLISMEDGKVRFRWKDYRDDNHQKTMTLPAEEFIRRFLIHVLPDGFHRIRYYGFLGNCHRVRKLALCRGLLGMAPPGPIAEQPGDYRDRFEALTGLSLRTCPHCHIGTMVVIDCIAPTKSANRFRTHHDLGSVFRPCEAEPPARSGWTSLATQANCKATPPLNGRIRSNLTARSCGPRGQRFPTAVRNVVLRGKRGRPGGNQYP